MATHPTTSRPPALESRLSSIDILGSVVLAARARSAVRWHQTEGHRHLPFPGLACVGEAIINSSPIVV